MNEQAIIQVAQLLGRTPKGLEEIMRFDDNHWPSVIRVKSLVDKAPFPTLFWLVDKALCYRLDGLEASGLIVRLQQRINADVGLQEALKEDHQKHIALRNSYMSDELKAELIAYGFYNTLQIRGIGGIENFASVRCLHTYYGAHLIEPNTIGHILDREYLNAH